MAALTADRNTVAQEVGRLREYRVAASTTIYNGSMVRLDATGFLIPGDDAANGSDCVGVANETVDNSGGADGDLSCDVQKGVFLFVNDSNVVQATVGVNCTILDDQTVSVAGTTTNDHVAGTVEDFDVDGQVAVKILEHAIA